MKRMHVRWWAPRLGLIFGGSLLGLFLAEGVARLMAPAGHADLLFIARQFPRALCQRPGTVAGARRDSNPKYNHWTIRFVSHQSKWIAWMEIAEETLTGSPSDSFTMAVQVSEEEFSGRLSQQMGTTVLNAGVDGYST